MTKNKEEKIEVEPGWQYAEIRSIDTLLGWQRSVGKYTQYLSNGSYQWWEYSRMVGDLTLLRLADIPLSIRNFMRA